MIQTTCGRLKPSYGKIYCVPNTILSHPADRLPRILFHTSSTTVDETHRTGDRLVRLRTNCHRSVPGVQFRPVDALKWINNYMKTCYDKIKQQNSLPTGRDPFNPRKIQTAISFYEYRNKDKSSRHHRGLHRPHVDGAVC